MISLRIVFLISCLISCKVFGAQDVLKSKQVLDEQKLEKEVVQIYQNVTDFFAKNMTNYLQDITKTYSKEVDKITRTVQDTPLKEITKTITLSDRLGRLTQTALAVFSRIEQILDDYELLLSKEDFFIRQEYTHKKNDLYSE